MTTNPDNIPTGLHDILMKHGSEHLGNVRLHDTFESLGMDSLDTIQAIMDIEEAFKIEIPEDAANQLQTVQDVIDHITAHESK